MGLRYARMVLVTRNDNGAGKHHDVRISPPRRKRDPSTSPLCAGAHAGQHSGDPSAARELSELDHALGYLSKGQREVVLLVGLEGMSYDEAAKIIHVPIGTIRSRLARAREALRLLMGIDEETGCGRRVTQRSLTLSVGLAA